jgi:hypothetical protein
LLHIEQWVEISSHFTPYLIVIAATLLFSAVMAILALRKPQVVALVLIGVCCNVVFLLTLVKGALQLNQNTAKPLVSLLQPMLLPSDEVVHYFKFYQDVPIYLGRRVTLVADWQAPDIAQRDNWVRELWYGMPFQNTAAWLINEKDFWVRFHGKKRVFVFLNENYFSQFKERAGKFFVVEKSNDIILVCNRDI